MKQTLLLAIILAIFAPDLSAQIFKTKYQRNLESAQKLANKARQDGHEIVLDPIETVPVDVSKRLTIAAQTNWGRDLLLPPALRQRLVNECTYKVTVKVADTGQPDHASLRQGQLPGANYTSAPTVTDLQGHSTHVSGIICADELGLCDALVDKGLVNYKNIKILGDNGSGSFDWVKNAIAAERADDQSRLNQGGFVVWNGSFGGGTALIDNVEAELKKSTDIGVVFCFAAGNTGTSGVNYPGNGKYSIAVGSLDQNQTRSSYSTTGPEVYIAMPGRNINSTYTGQTWATLSGTSMASPFGSGALAIAYSKWGPKLKGLDRVRAYIAWCAKDLGAVGRDSEYGWGIELIQNILDRDPDSTPGLPNDPVPPPPPSGDYTSIPTLNVALANEYSILWDNLAASAGKQVANTFKTAGSGSRAKNKGLANTVTKVRFEIRFASKGSANSEATKMQKAVAEYFTNRGFMLPAKQDESWAAYWASYFLEMGLSQIKLDIDVTKVTFVTGGQTVVIPEKDLLHWPRT